LPGPTKGQSPFGNPFIEVQGLGPWRVRAEPDLSVNGGRKLSEYRIVREAREIGSWDGAPRRFDLPAPPQGQGAVLLVQSDNLRVLGAAELPA
jgi:hypothetical protein